MKNNVVKKLEGYMPYNLCMPTHVEAFFSGSHDTSKKGCPPNDEEMCREFIREKHPSAKIVCVKATLYYEIPEDQMFCRKSPKCGEGICFCGDIMKANLSTKEK